MSDEKALMQTRQELSVPEAEAQIQKIQQLMKSVMKPDEHFGKIPGTKKDTLYKAGAEKLNFVFRLVPKFEIQKSELPGGHREYEVVCSISHIDGTFLGQGVGSCSTMESKYRYRYEDTDTGVAVPKQYWNGGRDEAVLRAAVASTPFADEQMVEDVRKAKLGTSKESGTWRIVIKKKAENPDIADVYNTVLKMAKKRAHVDATISVCAASDIFTQDLEEDFSTAPPPKEDKPPETKGGGKGDEKKQDTELMKAKATFMTSLGDMDLPADVKNQVAKDVHKAKSLADLNAIRDKLKPEIY